ncbi:hypothetical protein BT96DRAFT_558514 [Gymnopus androsaceus JB14]|uniref:MYND-type domain-containing protein n=1 Tax=Gymnopus androsaceus JB14 TaxID=1447944 RepID=A0A6A4HYM6_9AGAR|nr:hypothetical protein BT96DRAFT_558514 [Gymnopus androsaceus JB14]
MSTRIDLLKRRALSGKEGSNQALEELCTMTGDSRVFVDVLSVFQRFLSQHRPPPPEDVIHSVSPLDEIRTILKVLSAIYVGVGVRKMTTYNENIIMPSLRKFWSAIHSWCSFLVKAFIEHDLNLYGEFSHTGIAVINIVAPLCAILLMRGVIRLQEIKSIEGSAELLVRVHLYALFVESSPPIVVPALKSSRIEVSECASNMLNVFWQEGDRQSLWLKIYCSIIEDFHPHLICSLARVLSRLAQARTLNYHLLNYWFRVLSSIARHSDAFNRRFFAHRTVYFTTHIVCRISKGISHPQKGPIILMKDENVIGAWRWCVEYLWHTFEYGGFDNIIVALKSGFLVALWKLSRRAMPSSLPQHLRFSHMELFGKVLELIGAYSLYRVIQKPLERIFKNPLLDEIETDLDVLNGEPEVLWGRFKKLVLDRIAIRYEREEGVILCSNNKECKSPCGSKVFRCSGCMIAFYCGSVCQKSHWRQAHRQECHDHKQDHKAGLPRVAEDRDRKLVQAIWEAELDPIRSDLLQQQSAYRNSKRLRSDSVLVNFIDFTGSKLERYKVWTLDEAEEMTSFDWYEAAQTLKKMQQQGIDAGPIVSVTVLHSRQTMSMQGILRFSDNFDGVDNEN